jgi:lysylphosphatidylglycerol synthetase-like protein (DUF2156 family)
MRITQAHFSPSTAANSYFTKPGLPGVIVYHQTGAFLVQFGGPFAPARSCSDLLEAFRKFAGEQNRSIVGIQLQRADAELYAHRGFTMNQVGASYAVDLKKFALKGTRFMQLRNKIARARKAGLVVSEANLNDWGDAIRALDAVWLQGKGQHAKQLEFLVGQYGGDMQQFRRLFVGTIDGELAGYISYVPVHGARSRWMHDLSRRIPGKLSGIMEAINKTAIDTFIGDGVDWLHFGFTPFTGLDIAQELPGFSRGFNQTPMSTNTESHDHDSIERLPTELLTTAGYRLLELFGAVCGAPDDPVVAAKAQAALADLESLLPTAEATTERFSSLTPATEQAQILPEPRAIPSAMTR